MKKCRFKRILKAMKYDKNKPPRYKNIFWEVTDLINAWDSNMEKVLGPGWINCLDKSMSP